MSKINYENKSDPCANRNRFNIDYSYQVPLKDIIHYQSRLYHFSGTCTRGVFFIPFFNTF